MARNQQGKPAIQNQKYEEEVFENIIVVVF
jgi:hypothetical protein